MNWIWLCGGAPSLPAADDDDDVDFSELTELRRNCKNQIFQKTLNPVPCIPTIKTPRTSSIRTYSEPIFIRTFPDGVAAAGACGCHTRTDWRTGWGQVCRLGGCHGAWYSQGDRGAENVRRTSCQCRWWIIWVRRIFLSSRCYCNGLFDKNEKKIIFHSGILKPFSA